MDFPRDSFIQKIKDCNPEYKTTIMRYVDNLLNKGLPVIFSTKHLAMILGIDYSDFCQLLQNIDGYYAYFFIRKKDGGKRRIVVPYQNLKRIQRWILYEILDKCKVAPQCKGFIPHGSTLQNALPHLGKKYIRKFDFKDFFESITVKRVYGLFKEIGYSPAVSHDFATLCSLKISDERFTRFPLYKKQCFEKLHKIDNAVLPQGAPTSPAIANLICCGIDARLGRFADLHNIQYTRYADDLTFSANSIDKLPKCNFVRKVVEDENLKLNYKKTGTFGTDSRQMITGIMVDGAKPRVPQKFKRQIYRHLHFCKKFGTFEHFAYVMPNYQHARQWLYGKIMYVNAIEPEEAQKMFALANALNWGVMM